MYYALFVHPAERADFSTCSEYAQRYSMMREVTELSDNFRGEAALRKRAKAAVLPGRVTLLPRTEIAKTYEKITGGSN